jgi:hypothetical protein
MMENKKESIAATSLWLLLVGATILSFSLVEDTGYVRLASTLAVLIGAIKARLIFIHFMELTWNLRPQRLLFELWIVLVSVMFLAAYWLPVIRKYHS